MHATVCLLRAGQRRRAGDAAKSGQFRGQFSWVTGDPMGVKGLKKYSHKYYVCDIESNSFEDSERGAIAKVVGMLNSKCSLE